MQLDELSWERRTKKSAANFSRVKSLYSRSTENQTELKLMRNRRQSFEKIYFINTPNDSNYNNYVRELLALMKLCKNIQSFTIFTNKFP